MIYGIRLPLQIVVASLPMKSPWVKTKTQKRVTLFTHHAIIMVENAKNKKYISQTKNTNVCCCGSKHSN